MRPPKKCTGPRGILTRLRKLPYGIAEAGRKSAKVGESNRGVDVKREWR